VRREVLDQGRVQVEAVPGLNEDFCQEGERGDGSAEGEGEVDS